MSDRSVGLVIVGHGSHLNPDSSGPVYQHARRIRELGVFAHVLEAFWKEEPSLPDALDLVEADEVVAVPLFLAEGYFTRQVLPREMGLLEGRRPSDGRTVHYTRPVGTHPGMADLILRRAAQISDLDEHQCREAALVIIGHGTERSRTSGETVYRLTDQIRSAGRFGRVECGFLDEAPEIAGVLDAVEERHVILVPFFVAEGWHTRETIPADLGLDGARTEKNGRTIWYADPVGTMPEVADVIVELARDALEDRAGDPPAPERLEAVEAGRAFFDRVEASPGDWLRIMQVALGFDGRDYAIAHVDAIPSADPRDLAGSPGSSLPVRAHPTVEDPASLRDAALELVRFNARGEYRPLRSAPDLIGGWSLRGLDRDAAWAFLSVVYPAAVLHWYRGLNSTLRVGDFPTWAARQTAMYKAVRELEAPQVGSVVESLCDGCLRDRRWSVSGREGETMQPGPVGDDRLAVVPCREPCTVFATEARELAVAARPCRNSDGEPA